MRIPRAFALIELVIAMAILATIMGLAYGAIVGSLRDQGVQEASVNAQAKLRRVVEVMTQDIRSAVMGGVINAPYTSGSGAISFAMLDGGAGFPLSGSSATGTTVTALNSTASTLGIANGDTLFLLDTVQNRGILRTVSAAPVSTGTGTNQYTVSYASCANAANTSLAFKVSNQGYTYDSANKRLKFQKGSTEEVVAFNITAFTIQYVYRDLGSGGAAGTEVVNPTNYISGGSVQQSMTISSRPYYLQRIIVTLSSEEKASGRTITRTYTGQIELLGTDQQLSANNQPFIGVVSC